jgi:hypothetical protein
MQKFDMKSSNSRKLNGMEVTEQYQVKDRFAAWENRLKILPSVELGKV